MLFFSSKVIVFFCVFSFLFSCVNDKLTENYSDQITEQIIKKDLINVINYSITKVKTLENLGQLQMEDTDILVYHFVLNENTFYDVTYIFDAKGCFEIGVDIELGNVDALPKIVERLKTYFNDLTYLSEFSEDNALFRWRNKQKAITLEMDVVLISQGKLSITIFANE